VHRGEDEVFGWGQPHVLVDRHLLDCRWVILSRTDFQALSTLLMIFTLPSGQRC
jgi:hypothetical protein